MVMRSLVMIAPTLMMIAPTLKTPQTLTVTRSCTLLRALLSEYFSSQFCTWCSSVRVRVFVTIECVTNVSRLRHRPTRHSFISQEHHSNSNAQIHTQISRIHNSCFALDHRYFFVSSRRSKKKLDQEFQARSVEIEKLNSLVISQRETLKAKNREMQLMSKAWHLPWSDIELLQKLDRGAFGEVWRATYRENWDVAVKKMFRMW